jgi:proteasome lid subunit RPN8/RPN11
MASLLQTLLRAAVGPSPKLICDRRLWNHGVDELRRRAAGTRESGAFLLGTLKSGVRRIRQFLYYEDIDATCFTHGIVEFDGGKFGIVWEKCRESSMTVVADVHVHPGGCGQSSSDRHNPMIPESGHLALVLPNFATCARMPGGIGIYEYLGLRRWKDLSARGDRVFWVGWWPQ